MNKEEIKHFKAMLRQGSLRHMNIILDDKFQKELLNIIKDYEKLQQENQQLKEQVEVYENPDDLTLMFMYCGEKAKDKIKELQQRIEKAIEVLKLCNSQCAKETIDILKGDSNE